MHATGSVVVIMRVVRLTHKNQRFYLLVFVTVSSATTLTVVPLQKSEAAKSKVSITNTNVQQMNAHHFMKLVYLISGPVKSLERVKLEDGNAVEVSDIITIDPNGQSPVVMRSIQTLKVKDGRHTVVRLSLPRELTGNNIDTSKWDTDEDYFIHGAYYHIICETIFYASGVKMSRESNATILMVGLGGGAINSFLHHNFPKMTITVVEISATMVSPALKWFSLKLDDRHLIVVADGINFLEEQANRGVTYDAVVIDACYSEDGHDQMCPVDGFMDEKVIEKTSQVVSDQGVLVMNSVPRVRDVYEEGKFLNERFGKFFHHCNTRDTKRGNGVFYCMHRHSAEEHNIDLLSFLEKHPLVSVN